MENCYTELIESNKRNVKKMNELINLLKLTNQPVDKIEKAIQLRNKYQDIVDYNVKEIEELRKK